MDTNEPLRNLLDRTGYTESAALRYLMGCVIGHGFIKFPAGVNIYAFYRYFVELIMDANLPIRKPIAIHCKALNENSISPQMFGRSSGMQENMIQIADNFEHLIFPTSVPAPVIEARGQGEVYASSAEFYSENSPVKPLNDHYLFYSSNPVAIVLHTELATGLRTLAENARESKKDYIPVISHHNIFNHVRLVGPDEANSCIFYYLTDLSDESFVSLITSFISSQTQTLRDEESRVEMLYNSQAHWAEIVQDMITSLHFDASEKRGWTCIMRRFPQVKSMASFEALFKDCYRFDQACLFLEEIKLVSYYTAEKIMQFMTPKFKRRDLDDPYSHNS